MKSKVAIFTIVNKQEVYEEYCASLETQKDVDYTLIPIMNCHNEYDSARIAYNEATLNVDCKYYLFMHPDIRFQDEYSLVDIIRYVEKIDDFGVVGVAGAIQCGRKNRSIKTTIVQGENAMPVGEKIDAPMEVQTVDECMFVIESEYFKQNMFLQKKGWHLYAVEYCLDAITKEKKNYVVPARIWHLSDGQSLNSDYVMQLEELIQKEKPYFNLICTTVKAWETTGLFAILYRKYYYLKQKIKSIIGG